MSFYFDIARRAFQALLQAMGTTALAVVINFLIIPVVVALIMLLKSGFAELKLHWRKNLQDAALVTLGIWLLLYSYYLVYKVPHDIREQAQNVVPPAIPAPPVVPPLWDQRTDRKAGSSVTRTVPTVAEVAKQIELEHGPGKADLSLEFVGKDRLQFVFAAGPEESANQPKRFFGLWDITNPFFYDRYPGVVQALPLMFKTEADFVFHGHKQGPMDVLDTPDAIAHVKAGDRLFGIADVMCFNCAKEKSYWVYFEVGKGGWYAERDKSPWGQGIEVPKPNSTEQEQAATFDVEVPRELRKTIPER